MESLSAYNISEIIALLTAVLIGSGAYIAFVRVKRDKPINIVFIISTIVINIFLANATSELLKVFNWGAYRALILPIVAYSGQYLLEWFDKRRDKIFDSATKKVGFDINDKNNQDENKGDIN